jgi:hypothetical protein
MTSILLGLVPDSSSAEAAVNDYVEAGVAERRISLVMQDVATARAIANDAGPLKGTSPDALQARLVELGVSPTDAQALAAGVRSGQALIAVPVDPVSESNAIEVLRGVNGQHIITVPST